MAQKFNEWLKVREGMDYVQGSNQPPMQYVVWINGSKVMASRDQGEAEGFAKRACKNYPSPNCQVKPEPVPQPGIKMQGEPFTPIGQIDRY